MTDTAPRFIQIVNGSVFYDAVKTAVLDQLDRDFVGIEDNTKKGGKMQRNFQALHELHL
jgi:hypothetical protein